MSILSAAASGYDVAIIAGDIAVLAARRRLSKPGVHLPLCPAHRASGNANTRVAGDMHFYSKLGRTMGKGGKPFRITWP